MRLRLSADFYRTTAACRFFSGGNKKIADPFGDYRGWELQRPPTDLPMKHQLLFLGKIKDRFIEEGVGEYGSRLQHYTSFGITVLKEKGRGRGKLLTAAEQGKLLLQAVPSGATIVVLDSQGKQFTSEAFSRKIDEWEMQGIKQVCYLIGGPDGHAAEVLAAADLLVSLSKMTFTHDMARLLLVEQLYRAYTIKAGEQYHK